MVDDARALLADAVKGKSDDEIMALVATFGGTEPALDTIFEGMKSALNPDNAVDCVIGYELTDDSTTYAYTVTVKDKTATYEKREPSDARVTIGLTVTDFLRLITGDLDAMQAFMQGKLKLKGDMMFAQQIPQMFGL